MVHDPMPLPMIYLPQLYVFKDGIALGINEGLKPNSTKLVMDIIPTQITT